MPSQQLRLAATLLPLALALGACGTGEGTSATPATPTSQVATASPELDGITVTVAEAPGSTPTLDLPATPFTVAAPGHRVISDGDGPEITLDQTVSAHYLLVNGKDGSELQSSFGQQVVMLSLDADTLQPAIREAMLGRHVGARVLIAIPAREALGPEGDAQANVAVEDTLLYYFEVTNAKTPLQEATGTPVPPREGLPTVTMGATPADPARFTMPAGPPPTQTVAQPLIVGEGPVVENGQTVRVRFTGVTWREPDTPFDHTGTTPQQYFESRVGAGKLIKAWEEHLPGQTVGSRLLLVVAPADGYGSAGSPPAISGTDTLVFVIDILDAT